MASLNSRFAGLGPALFTDFDEYAMYELRGLDVGGANFIYPPVALAHLSKGHGGRERLDAVPPAKLRAYPLIVTRRNPSANRPPSAYSLIWQGTYYQVWRRQTGAPTAIVHSELTGGPGARCRRIQRAAQIARSRGAQLVAATAPELVRISVPGARHPASWTHTLVGLVMKGPGRLRTTFETPRGGPWDIWVEGQIMRPVHISVDGRPIGSIGGQLGGNSLNPDIMSPLSVRLAAGRHLLSLTHGGATLAPGDGGWAVLARIFLTPSGAGALQSLRTVPAASWRSLCGQRLNWIEVVRA